MITERIFDLLPNGEVFAKGILPNSSDGLFMTSTNTDDLLKWMAVKGYDNDWVIYCGWYTSSYKDIKSNGDTVIYPDHIKRCVQCTDEVFKLYRY